MRITARLTASCDNSLRVWKWSKLVKVFPVVASRKRFLAHSINSMCTENVYRRFQGTDKTFRKINNCTKRGQFQFQTEYLPRTPEKKQVWTILVAAPKMCSRKHVKSAKHLFCTDVFTAKAFHLRRKLFPSVFVQHSKCCWKWLQKAQRCEWQCEMCQTVKSSEPF